MLTSRLNSIVVRILVICCLTVTNGCRTREDSGNEADVKVLEHTSGNGKIILEWAFVKLFAKDANFCLYRAEVSTSEFKSVQGSPRILFERHAKKLFDYYIAQTFLDKAYTQAKNEASSDLLSIAESDVMTWLYREATKQIDANGLTKSDFNPLTTVTTQLKDSADEAAIFAAAIDIIWAKAKTFHIQSRMLKGEVCPEIKTILNKYRS